MLAQVSAGNLNSCFLSFEDEKSFIVTCGVTPVTIEGQPEIEKNFITTTEALKFEQVSSLLYNVPFNLPVVKVACGD